jgi:hypothetical protein
MAERLAGIDDAEVVVEHVARAYWRK